MLCPDEVLPDGASHPTQSFPIASNPLPEQPRKLMTMIGTAVNGLKRLDTIVPGVRNLGMQHGAYGVRNEHYDTVASALLWTLEQGLGPTFTTEARDAWVAVYTLLANTMKSAAS